jgi:hypothetical protein
MNSAQNQLTPLRRGTVDHPACPLSNTTRRRRRTNASCGTTDGRAARRSAKVGTRHTDGWPLRPPGSAAKTDSYHALGGRECHEMGLRPGLIIPRISHHTHNCCKSAGYLSLFSPCVPSSLLDNLSLLWEKRLAPAVSRRSTDSRAWASNRKGSTTARAEHAAQ